MLKHLKSINALTTASKKLNQLLLYKKSENSNKKEQNNQFDIQNLRKKKHKLSLVTIYSIE